MKWTATLFNQHAMCGIAGHGRTRRTAFDAAYRKAGPEFRAYGFAEGNDVMWLATFNDMVALMRRGTHASTFRDTCGRVVELRRLADQHTK